METGRNPIRPGRRPSPRCANCSIVASMRKGMDLRLAATQPQLHASHDRLVSETVVKPSRRGVELVHIELDRVDAVRPRKNVHVLEQKRADASCLPLGRHHQEVHVEPRTAPMPAASDVLELEPHTSDRAAWGLGHQQARTVGPSELLQQLCLVLRRQRLELIGVLIEIGIVHLAIQGEQGVAVLPHGWSHTNPFGCIDADRLHGGYSRSATHERTDWSAAGSASGLVPPAWAISGRPPPLPPTCAATWLTRSPAFIRPVKSEVTPAMSVTFPPSVEPSTIAADLNRPLSLSSVSRSTLASAPSTVVAR